MARSVDLFIAYDGPIEDLAALVARRTPYEVGPGSDAGTWELRHGGLDGRLERHDLLDDGELALSRYPYVLGVRTNAAGHLGAGPEVALLRAVAADLDDLRVLLVLDLQHRVGSAVEEPGS